MHREIVVGLFVMAAIVIVSLFFGRRRRAAPPPSGAQPEEFLKPGEPSPPTERR
jgi:hypothetical protein